MSWKSLGFLYRIVHHFLRVRAVERRLAARGAALVGDRQERRPLRCPGAGAADLEPAVGRPVVWDGVIDGDAGCRRCVVGDVRGGSRRRGLRHDALLVRRLRLVGAGAAAAAAPADLARPGIARAERQGRPADGQDVRRSGRPRGRRAAVARGRHERHAGLAQSSAVVRRLARELAAAPAHRHDIGMGRRVGDGGEQVGVIGGAGLDQHDGRPGRHGVRPLHVERLLELPTARRIGWPDRLVPPVSLTRMTVVAGRPNWAVEGVQIGLDVRVVVGIDDGDRLAGPCPRRRCS